MPLSARDLALRDLYLNGTSAGPVAWVCFQASLPAAGYAAYFLVPAASVDDAPHTHASVLTVASRSGDSTVTNGRISLTISAATGWMSGFADSSSGLTLPLSQSWAGYIGFDGNSTLNGSNQASGAYIFRPLHPVPVPIVPGPASVVLVSGPVVNEAQHSYGYVSQSTRLWARSAEVELDWTVGPVNVTDKQR